MHKWDKQTHKCSTHSKHETGSYVGGVLALRGIAMEPPGQSAIVIMYWYILSLSKASVNHLPHHPHRYLPKAVPHPRTKQHTKMRCNDLQIFSAQQKQDWLTCLRSFSSTWHCDGATQYCSTIATMHWYILSSPESGVKLLPQPPHY